MIPASLDPREGRVNGELDLMRMSLPRCYNSVAQFINGLYLVGFRDCHRASSYWVHEYIGGPGTVFGDS